jgi:hypothetical protein
MQRIPDDEILAAHREYYGAREAVAPPEVRNAQAMAALGEHRAYRWRGHSYRVPPVPFTPGWQLFVARQVLDGDVGERDRETAVRLARRVAGALLEPRRWRRNPLRTASAEALVEVIAFLLSVPDESPVASADGTLPRTIDLIDGLMEFSRVFPALVNAAGLPVSWAHYQHGLRHLRKAYARDEIRMAQASRLAQATPEVWRRYANDLRREVN